MQVTEHRGLLMILLNLTTNPSLTDISFIVITINGTATGEVNNSYMYLLYYY